MEEETDARFSIEDCWNELQKGVTNENDLVLDNYMRVDEDLVVADYPTDADIFDSVVPNESQIEED